MKRLLLAMLLGVCIGGGAVWAGGNISTGGNIIGNLYMGTVNLTDEDGDRVLFCDFTCTDYDDVTFPWPVLDGCEVDLCN